MTLDQIKYFLAAAEFQHVGKAATSVHISPSAVSAAISSLESELKTKLFERRSKRIYLTAAGHKFKTWGHGILNEIESVRYMISKGETEYSGRYRLGASHFLASELLGPTFFELQNKHRNLFGDIRSLDTGVLIGDILNGRLDLGVTFSVVAHPEIDQHKIYEGTLVIVARKGHPLLRKKGASRIQALANYSSVTHKPTQGSEVCENHPIFSKLGIFPKVSMYFDSDAIALDRLKNSDDWALLPEYVIQKKRDEFSVVHQPSISDASYFIAVVKHSCKNYDPFLSRLTKELENKVKTVKRNR